MSFLHDFNFKNNLTERNVNSSEVFSVFYHNIFEYPLTFSELVKWTPKNAPKINIQIEYKNGFYFVKGREGLIYKRTVSERVSQQKIKIAERASKTLSLIPSVLMVGLTGSLAMNNANEKGDIDFIIVTKSGKLWTTRGLVYLLLKLSGFKLRSPRTGRQKDKLCLNIWLDEHDLAWNKHNRNYFTAHEILQTIPLFNRGKTYERLLSENKWVLNFWPNAVEIKQVKKSQQFVKSKSINLVELLAYKTQYLYMRGKITKEKVSLARAIFHPNNLSKKIMGKLGY